VQDSKAGELIPRITFREVEDAEMLAVILATTAQTVMQNIRLANAAKIANDLGLPVFLSSDTPYSSGRSELTPDEMLARQHAHRIRLIDVVNSVAAELRRLREGIGNEEDKRFVDGFAAIVDELQSVGD
jgi:hypothetical protein